MPITFDRHCFHLCNDRVSYIIRLAAGKYPLHLYWGRRLRAVRDDLLSRRVPFTDDTFTLNETSLDQLPQECPTFAGSDLREGMVHVFHENGTHALILEYESHEIRPGKPALGGLPSARGEEAESLLLTLRDRVSGVAVELCYTVYPDVDIIARSARVINGGQTPVVVDKALSACVDFEQSDYTLLTLGGAWARERQPFTRPARAGG